MELILNLTNISNKDIFHIRRGLDYIMSREKAYFDKEMAGWIVPTKESPCEAYNEMVGWNNGLGQVCTQINSISQGINHISLGKLSPTHFDLFRTILLDSIAILLQNRAQDIMDAKSIGDESVIDDRKPLQQLQDNIRNQFNQ